MNLKNIPRRLFLKIFVLNVFFTLLWKTGLSRTNNLKGKKISSAKIKKKMFNLGVDKDGLSRVYIGSGDTPENNIKKTIELMGGIEKYIGTNDIVILKPNAQWWNQGTTNTNNMKGFIELVLLITGFNGEIIIAENHHYKELNSRGWVTEERNGDYNLNELVNYFNKKGFSNVSKYHWIDAGPNPQPQEGNGGGGRVVQSVSEGDGYVWLKDELYVSSENRKCMMSYPVFTSPYSGKKIDLKKGCYENGKYVNKVKLINFSCLNHHSHSFGITASIKNLMGVVDLTYGYHGSEPKGYYNFHFIGKMSPLYKAGNDIKYYGGKIGIGSGLGKKIQKMGYWNTQYTGGALGFWMKSVRLPDLNILAAEYVGWGGRGRNGPHGVSKANTVVISTDPVALDYVGAKQILFPATPKEKKYYRKLNNPDNKPFSLFLDECHAQGIGNRNEKKIQIIKAS